MEINPLDIDEHQLQFNSGQARPYTCAFCKRGFSNAQALGGHMNIHRRDRARLRQEEEDEENQDQRLSLDLIISTGRGAGPSSDDQLYHQDKVSRDRATTSSSKTVYSPGRDGAISGAAKRVIDPAGTEEVSRVITLSLDARIGKEKMGLSDGGGGGSSSSGKAELVDLELRLGPEPHDTTSKKSTR